MSSGTWGQQRYRSDCADEGLRSPRTETLDTTECFNEKPEWDFAHVQHDVNTHILHMLEGTFCFTWPIDQNDYRSTIVNGYARPNVSKTSSRHDIRSRGSPMILTGLPMSYTRSLHRSPDRFCCPGLSVVHISVRNNLKHILRECLTGTSRRTCLTWYWLLP